MTRLFPFLLLLLAANCAPAPDARPNLSHVSALGEGPDPKLVPLPEIRAAIPAHSPPQSRRVAAQGQHLWPADDTAAVQTSGANGQSDQNARAALAATSKAAAQQGVPVASKLSQDAAALRAKAAALQAPVQDSETREKLRNAIQDAEKAKNLSPSAQ